VFGERFPTTERYGRRLQAKVEAARHAKATEEALLQLKEN
tara:strand:- start:275 stop:394 length:120 start_codon:yes stop_codon:yes gene_type:complete